jgi:aryl-alcohol dehydrogenase-like predicted oxidoreductase
MEIPFPPSLKRSLETTKVEYVQVGSSGLRVSRPILGAMLLGSSQVLDIVLDEDESLEVLKAAYDCGINTWDTANTYCNGLGEELFGKAMRKFNIPRSKLVIMTKCYQFVGEEPDVIANYWGMKMDLHQSKDYVNQGGKSDV